MTPALLLWILIAGLLVSTFASTGAQVLHSFAKHEFEEYCERRGKPLLFGLILDLEDRILLSVQTLRIITTTIVVAAAVSWLLSGMALTEVSIGRWISIVAIVSMMMVVANNWIPYAISQICAPAFLFRTWRIWYVFSFAVYPIMIGSKFVRELLQRATGTPDDQEDEEEALEDEIRSMISEGEHDGLLDEDEREMIEGVIELDKQNVGSIMTSRSKVDALDILADWNEMLEFVVECGRTRIPVYESQKDNVVGVLYSKDLLSEIQKSESKRRPLKKLVRDPLYVPASKLLDEMLETFQNLRVHLAIVRDEYGGMAGVVTIEDVLEEIVGEIVDETDNEQRNEIRVTSPGAAEVQGAAHVEMLNEVLGLELPEDEEFDTIGGLLMNELKEVPRVGHEVVIGKAKFRIEKASRRSIEKLTVVVSDSAES